MVDDGVSLVKNDGNDIKPDVELLSPSILVHLKLRVFSLFSIVLLKSSVFLQVETECERIPCSSAVSFFYGSIIEYRLSVPS